MTAEEYRQFRARVQAMGLPVVPAPADVRLPGQAVRRHVARPRPEGHGLMPAWFASLLPCSTCRANVGTDGVYVASGVHFCGDCLPRVRAVLATKEAK